MIKINDCFVNIHTGELGTITHTDTLLGRPVYTVHTDHGDYLWGEKFLTEHWRKEGGTP